MQVGDKIMKLRKQQGWSQEELANRLDVTRQSVSKWESGMSVPELEKIVRLSEVFGVTTDFLLRNEEEPVPMQEPAVPSQPEEETRYVGTAEAEAFLNLVLQAGRKIALGVTLCVLSPVLLIVLCGLADTMKYGITDKIATGIGMTVLLLMVASAVTLFILHGLKLEKFDYLEQETILLEPTMLQRVRQLQETYGPTFRKNIAVGVVLCIVGVVPLILVSVLYENGTAVACCVALLLVVVSVAVNLFVRSAMVWDSYQKLLEEGDYTKAKKLQNERNSTLSTVYWCTVLALYLGYSFITFRWGISWIIWPVAAVLYAAVEAVASAVRK